MEEMAFAIIIALKRNVNKVSGMYLHNPSEMASVFNDQGKAVQDLPETTDEKVSTI